MDHYKVLGLSRTANKEEIKEAFRKLAMEFHPDKHAQSPKSVRDGATRRFKQVSEAYEVLIDDRKRADYNLRRNSGGGRSATASGGGGYRGYGYGYYNNRHNHTYGKSASGFASDGGISKFEIVLRFLSTRVFLLNAAFAWWISYHRSQQGGTMEDAQSWEII
ncbi:chaperone protein dnaJ 72-like isoform X2 [Cornus florida]|uniref:chaperone protein dnaJ 72-like isoform X2 n=1 Tax=Cornus florida TaxID=4283 RepID=UPI002898BE97|nr:chaperone protein dnaJ 72-like isoform X2 [Cornus florida]